MKKLEIAVVTVRISLELLLVVFAYFETGVATTCVFLFMTLAIETQNFEINRMKKIYRLMKEYLDIRKSLSELSGVPKDLIGKKDDCRPGSIRLAEEKDRL